MRNISLIILFVIIYLSKPVFPQTNAADLIIYNAKIYMLDDDFSISSAMAIKNGRILALGDDRILKDYDSENLLDLNGKFVYPGFNDGHSHFLSYGISLTKYADLVGTRSFDAVVERLKEHDRSYPSKWVLGRGWDQNDWQHKEFPDNSLLNEFFPDRPVVLTRIDGHAVIANDYALKVAGINAATKIKGGEIILKNGRPSGVLVDNAAGLIKSTVPGFSEKEKSLALMKAQYNCFAAGLTTVSDAGLDKQDILLIKRLQDNGKLKIKVYAMINPNKENFDYFYNIGPQHYDRLTVSAVKLYSDGALGSRGALLLKPYSDDAGNYGLQMHTESYFLEMCSKAYDAGFQVNTHAIGDSANRIMLKAYSEILRSRNDKRWRVEHAQIVSPDDIAYFKDFSIIPSVQATHSTSDMYWADERLGDERLKSAYAYKNLMGQNGWLVNGTDFPIEDISPLKTFFAAVIRKDVKGLPENGFQIENALDRKDALRSITIWPAKGSFDEKEKGSLEKGKRADFVVLDTDLIKAGEEQLLKAKVVSTYVDGEKVY
ncbi:MAG: amidohydrolase family protein [Chlorobi bacterium]|nr:amidohydrolase family protein [Chlorobiota bacterium]